MKFAVIKIVISFIISGISLAAGDIGNQLAITDGQSTKIQSCVAKVIEHILNPWESIAFVINSHPDYIPSRLPNPVTVVDIRVPLPTNYKRYEVNYVIEAESFELFAQAIDTIIYYNSNLWHKKESPKGKFVILIKGEKALQNIFYAMWRDIWALHIIVVIYEDSSKNYPMKVITSNPQAEGNNCARKPTVFSNFSCDNISVKFLKPIRNYNGCPVFIQLNNQFLEFDFNAKRDRITYNLLAGLKHTLNVSPILLFTDSKVKVTLQQVYDAREIIMMECYLSENDHWHNSIIFSRRLFLWKGPPLTKISPLNTVFLPFKYDLWITVLLITILIMLVKWIIMKGNGYNNNYNNLACAFTDIIGLTFGVCVNRIPNIWSLKLLLAFFLVYVIHIHIAYTSDLINILTAPRYESIIKNVEEVAVSGLPIFMPDNLARNYFSNVSDHGGLLGKISKLIISLSDKDLNSLKAKNCFIVCAEDDAKQAYTRVRFNSKYLRKIKASLFLSNDVSGEIKEVFLLQNGSYFAESLNALITHLWESGTQEADGHLNPNPYYNVTMKEPLSVWNTILKTNIVRPLRLKDLLPVFVILLICYSFCVIIFVAEIFVHKIVAHITRNRVVPLNV